MKPTEIIPDDDEGGAGTTQEQRGGTGDVNQGQNNAASRIEAGEAPKARGAKTPAKGLPKRKYVRIILEESEAIAPSGQYFGHNGMGYLLKPGVAANVPVGIVDILDNAVMSVPQLDPQTKKVVGHRDRLRFPYRVVQPAA